MVYLDNAATSYPKPEVVYERVNHILRYIGGNPGRSGHRMAMEASRIIFEARETIARLFNIQDSSRIVFTKNATEGINLVLKGLLRPGGHVVTTTLEHNAVAHPLRRLERGGVKVTRVSATREGYIKPDDVENTVRRETRLVAVVHASNVLGTILPVGEIGEICRQKGIPLMVDAAQTAGAIPIDVEAMKIDILVATGHKALFGPQGTGFVSIRDGIEPLP
ncbi:MAG: aminotransferase class V-fold PLP-dependent enzyme, partial [Deltaproteobacteria bacterium]|nr:aminotransferase class V-fold PLP-dependent enzyme [Deltaproteobacteria bacterium]